MSQDSEFAQTPDYGSAPTAAPKSAADEMSAPPQMSAFARLGNIFFSPGEVFEDVRRSPRDWWLPVILLVILSSASGYLLQWKLQLTPEVLAAAAVDAGLEQQGKTRKDLSDDQKQGVAVQEKFTAAIFRFGPIFGIVFSVIFFGIASLVYWVIMMVMQAKTTFFRVLSVVTYAFFAPNAIKALLQIVYTFLVNPDNVDPKGFIANGSLLTTSLAFLTSAKDHPVLWTLLSWVDVFSLWFIALTAIGLGIVALKRKGFSAALAIAAPPYLLMWLIAVGFKLLTAR